MFRFCERSVFVKPVMNKMIHITMTKMLKVQIILFIIMFENIDFFRAMVASQTSWGPLDILRQGGPLPSQLQELSYHKQIERQMHAHTIR